MLKQRIAITLVSLTALALMATACSSPQDAGSGKSEKTKLQKKEVKSSSTAPKPKKQAPAVEKKPQVNPFAGATQEALVGVTEEHKRLDHFAGYWDAEFQMYTPTGAKQTSFKSRVHREWEKGGFFMNETRTAKETPEGLRGEATHIYGYDSAEGEYFAFLYGEGLSTPMRYRGQYDEAKKTLILSGQWQMKNGGKVMLDANERLEIAPLKDGKQVMKLFVWGSMNGQKVAEHLHLQITYTKDELERDPAAYGRYVTDAKPSKGHERLKAMVGEWESTTIVTPMGMPPSELKGKSVFKSTMGDRFVVETFEGDEAAQESPMYLDLQTTHGFNNARGIYQTQMIRAGGWNTHMENYEGAHDAKKKAVVMYSRYWDAVNDRWVGIKYIRHDIVNKDGVESFKVEGFFDFEGKKAFLPAYTTVYTRKAK